MLHAKSVPHDALRAFPQIAERVRNARQCALFLDLDGTLVGFRRRPEDVQLSGHVKSLLERLVRHKKVSVAIVSGRRVSDLKRLVSVEGIRLLGVHGAEQLGRTKNLSRQTSFELETMKLYARLSFCTMREIWIEDKRLSFAVHYRGAKAPAVRSVKQTMLQGFEPFRGRLRILKGEMVWEVLPKELQGKGEAVRGLMRKFPPGTLGIYIGDGATDEPAFAALRRGITVHTGRDQNTQAEFRLQNPAAALRFLGMLEREIP